MSAWVSIYKQQPEDGQIVTSRVSNEQGYTSGTEFHKETSTFRTYEDKRNRFVITIWKHDEWQLPCK